MTAPVPECYTRPVDPQAYLLAAGRGRRAGGPKAWRDCEGTPLLERQLAFLSSVVPPRRIAVSVQEEWLPRCRELDARVRWVAVDPDEPALAALQDLIDALPPEGPVFVYHVDMRVWEKGLFDALSAAGPDAVPMRLGKRGHPALLSPETLREARALPRATGRLDELLRGRAREIPVPWDCALDNWNDGH